MPLYLNLILILIDFTFVSWFYSYIFCFIIDLCSKSLILVQVFWFFKSLVIIYLLIHLFSFDILDAVPICLQFLLMFSCKIDYFADLSTCWFGSPQFFCALQNCITPQSRQSTPPFSPWLHFPPPSSCLPPQANLFLIIREKFLTAQVRNITRILMPRLSRIGLLRYLRPYRIHPISKNRTNVLSIVLISGTLLQRISQHPWMAPWKAVHWRVNG